MEHDADVRARLVPLGKCFEVERKRRGWSERQAVRIVGGGFTRAQLYRIESGEPVRSVACQRYAKALGMCVELVPKNNQAQQPVPVVGCASLASNVFAFTLGQGEDDDAVYAVDALRIAKNCVRLNRRAHQVQRICAAIADLTITEIAS